MLLLPYSHAVLLAELSDSELVHGGGHFLDGLLQVLGVALHQRLGDATPPMLQGRRGERETLAGRDGTERGVRFDLLPSLRKSRSG